ncbi:MAG: peptidylprolyl isomerase, partial [Coprobacillaceae bacterium]
AYVNDEEIDSKELEFYYGYSLMKYINQYYSAFDEDGFNMMNFNIDEDINSLQNQDCSIEGYEGKSWEYYFVSKATEMYQEIESLYIEAKKEKYETTKEDETKAEEAYNSIVSYCETNEIDENDYLHSTFGKDMTKETLIEYYTKVELANRYAQTLLVEPTDDQIETYYEKYKDDIDTVTIRYFAFSKEQEAEAEAFKNSVTNEEDFKQLAITYSNEENKEYYQNDDLTLRSYLRKDDVPEYLQDVLFGEVTNGTTMVVEGTTSYDVVMFVSRDKPSYQQAQVSTIYLDARESNEDSLTDEKLQASKEFAEGLLTSFLAEENPSIDTFHQYNQSYSDDKTNQGDYDAISRGDSTKEIENWVFDQTRVAGDTAVLPSTYGYSILYFRGYGEVEYQQRTKEIAVERVYDETIESLKNTLVIRIEEK